MKDFLGRPLALDDSVIIIAPQYRNFVLARVIGFTPKNVRVAYMNTWNFGSPGVYKELLQDPTQILKVDGPDLTMFLLKKKD